VWREEKNRGWIKNGVKKKRGVPPATTKNKKRSKTDLRKRAGEKKEKKRKD